MRTLCPTGCVNASGKGRITEFSLIAPSSKYFEKECNIKMFKFIKKDKQNSDSSGIQFEQTPECIDRANLILSERQMPGIQWDILLDGKQVTQYCYFENNVAHFSVGTEAIDGPDILLSRDYYIYFYAQYDEKSDSYLVITDFDGPFKNYPHGKKFVYGIDSFTLL